MYVYIHITPFHNAKRQFRLHVCEPTSTCVFQEPGGKGNREEAGYQHSVSDSQPQESKTIARNTFKFQSQTI